MVEYCPFDNLLFILNCFQELQCHDYIIHSEYLINVIVTMAPRISTHTQTHTHKHTHTLSTSQDTDATKLFLSFKGTYEAAKAKGVVFLAELEDLEVAMRSV